MSDSETKNRNPTRILYKLLKHTDILPRTLIKTTVFSIVVLSFILVLDKILKRKIPAETYATTWLHLQTIYYISDMVHIVLFVFCLITLKNTVYDEKALNLFVYNLLLDFLVRYELLNDQRYISAFMVVFSLLNVISLFKKMSFLSYSIISIFLLWRRIHEIYHFTLQRNRHNI